MARPSKYRVLTQEQAEKLQFHNLKRLMNKVRAHIGFWENTNVFEEYVDCDPLEYILRAHQIVEELEKHRRFFEMLREVSRNHPHQKSPKLRKNHGVS